MGRDPSPLPDNTATGRHSIFLAASLWVVRVDAGINRREKAELDKWLAASPRHAAVFERLTQLRRSLLKLKTAKLDGTIDPTLVFHGTPLSKAISEFNRSGKARITRERGVPNVPVTGIFSADHIEPFLRYLSKARLGFRVVRRSKTEAVLRKPR